MHVSSVEKDKKNNENRRFLHVNNGITAVVSFFAGTARAPIVFASSIFCFYRAVQGSIVCLYLRRTWAVSVKLTH